MSPDEKPKQCEHCQDLLYQLACEGFVSKMDAPINGFTNRVLVCQCGRRIYVVRKELYQRQ